FTSSLPPRTPLFPYTTLFRSEKVAHLVSELDGGDLSRRERRAKLADRRVAVSAQGRYTVGGSVSIGTFVFRSSAALFSIPSRACVRSRSGSSISREGAFGCSVTECRE